jgi:hypothetical protein
LVETMKHSLANKDKVALTADCSVCGPASTIVKVGNGYGCQLAVREAKRNYRKAHPERVRASKALNPATHKLTVKTGEADTCVVCGPVEPVAWGRGWMCPTIIRERGWTVTQTAPAPKCRLCNKQWLVDGQCPACDMTFADLDSQFLPLESRRAGHLRVAALYEEMGFTITETESSLPNGNESAVPGWKTLGSQQIVKNGQGFTVRPEYAALYGSGSM